MLSGGLSGGLAIYQNISGLHFTPRQPSNPGTPMPPSVG